MRRVVVRGTRSLLFTANTRNAIGSTRFSDIGFIRVVMVASTSWATSLDCALTITGSRMKAWSNLNFCSRLSEEESVTMMQTASQTRQCRSCKKGKPLSEFHPTGEGTFRWVCKSCRNAKNQEYYSNKTRDQNLRAKYGISLEQYEELLEMQGGACAICGLSSNEGRRKFDLDHDHSTGRIRGILCGRCNIALGGFRDDLDLLLSAAIYLMRVEA